MQDNAEMTLVAEIQAVILNPHKSQLTLSILISFTETSVEVMRNKNINTTYSFLLNEHSQIFHMSTVFSWFK